MKLWDLSGYSERTTSKRPTCQKLAFWGKLCLRCRMFSLTWPRGQHLCKFIGTKESICIRKEFNSRRICLRHQHGCRFIVLDTNMATVTSCENALLAQLCSDNSIQILLNLTQFMTLGTESNIDVVLSEYPDKSHNFTNFIFMTSSL